MTTDVQCSALSGQIQIGPDGKRYDIDVKVVEP